MARTKLKRLNALQDLNNVFIGSADIKNGLNDFFRSSNRFTIEIGCGHGDYSVELAKIFPGRNFIGIDVKGARIYKGAMKVLNLGIKNVAFILTKAEKLKEIFLSQSIEEIYIPFPEPHVKRSNQNRRLVSMIFLNLFRELLIDAGLVHLKTDSEDLFKYAIKNINASGGNIIYSTENLHNNEAKKFSPLILTSFEKHYIKEGRIIKYICFRF